MLYNIALIDQSVRSIRENIRTLVFRTDPASFGPYFKIAVPIFSRMYVTAQLVSKSIVSELLGINLNLYFRRGAKDLIFCK